MGSLLLSRLVSGRLPSVGIMKIKVKNLRGVIDLEIDPTESVKRIKERLAELERIPASFIKLVVACKWMEEDKTATDYELTEGSEVWLIPIKKYFPITLVISDDTMSRKAWQTSPSK